MGAVDNAKVLEQANNLLDADANSAGMTENQRLGLLLEKLARSARDRSAMPSTSKPDVSRPAKASAGSAAPSLKPFAGLSLSTQMGIARYAKAAAELSRRLSTPAAKYEEEQDLKRMELLEKRLQEIEKGKKG